MQGVDTLMSPWRSEESEGKGEANSSDEERGMSEQEARRIAGKFKGAGTSSKPLRSLIEDEKEVEKERDERLSRLRD